eukprot:3634704-Pleurochrysis_carterae.AAC.1
MIAARPACACEYERSGNGVKGSVRVKVEVAMALDGMRNMDSERYAGNGKLEECNFITAARGHRRHQKAKVVSMQGKTGELVAAPSLSMPANLVIRCRMLGQLRQESFLVERCSLCVLKLSLYNVKLERGMLSLKL